MKTNLFIGKHATSNNILVNLGKNICLKNPTNTTIETLLHYYGNFNGNDTACD